SAELMLERPAQSGRHTIGKIVEVPQPRKAEEPWHEHNHFGIGRLHTSLPSLALLRIRRACKTPPCPTASFVANLDAAAFGSRLLLGSEIVGSTGAFRS